MTVQKTPPRDLKKPIEAIQCSNTFSLLQRKMYNVLLANAYDRLFPDVTHQISMRALCNLMGYCSNDYKKIKEKFRELRRMDIEWDVMNERGNNVWTNTSPLSLARVIEGEGICEYEFTASLVPFLSNPAAYARFSLLTQSKFSSSYGLALYENCERYRNIGQTKLFNLTSFRKLMGVPQDKYQDFFALKRRVIDKAVEEVNKHAEFNIEPKYKKEGRKIIGIRFGIYLKNKKVEENFLPSPNIHSEFELLVSNLKTYFKLRHAEINQYIKKYGPEYVSAKVKLILSSNSFKKGTIHNMAAYLKKALFEDYSEEISSDVYQLREERSIESDEDNKQILLRELQAKYEHYVSEYMGDLVTQLSQFDKEVFLEVIEPHLLKSGYGDFYKKQGLANLIVAKEVVEFLKMNHPHLMRLLKSFDVFLGENFPQESKLLQPTIFDVEIS